MEMGEQKTAKDLSDDELAEWILNALCEGDLTHDQVMALSDSRIHAAVVLETLQATGLVQSYCGPIQPSTCKYRLVANCQHNKRGSPQDHGRPRIELPSTSDTAIPPSRGNPR